MQDVSTWKYGCQKNVLDTVSGCVVYLWSSIYTSVSKHVIMLIDFRKSVQVPLILDAGF